MVPVGSTDHSLARVAYGLELESLCDNHLKPLQRCASNQLTCVLELPFLALFPFRSCFILFFGVQPLLFAVRLAPSLVTCANAEAIHALFFTQSGVKFYIMRSRPRKNAVTRIATVCIWLTFSVASSSDKVVSETEVPSVCAEHSFSSDDHLFLGGRGSRRHELQKRAIDYQRRCWINASTESNRFRVGPSHYVHDKHFDVVYLEVPKSASTAIALNLRQASPTTTQALRKGSWLIEQQQQQSQRSSKERRELLWFSCVRDPIARFVSNVNFLTVMDRSLQHLRNPSLGNVSGPRAADEIADRILRQGFFNWHLWPQSLYLSRFVAWYLLLMSCTYMYVCMFMSSRLRNHRPNASLQCTRFAHGHVFPQATWRARTFEFLVRRRVPCKR